MGGYWLKGLLDVHDSAFLGELIFGIFRDFGDSDELFIFKTILLVAAMMQVFLTVVSLDFERLSLLSIFEVICIGL